MEHEEQISPSRQRRSKQQIIELLDAFAKSNSTVKNFCATHHISPTNFHKWKGRYKIEPKVKKKSIGFARMDIVAECKTGQLYKVSQKSMSQIIAAKYAKSKRRYATYL